MSEDGAEEESLVAISRDKIGVWIVSWDALGFSVLSGTSVKTHLHFL
jgi:hypothetical protein